MYMISAKEGRDCVYTGSWLGLGRGGGAFRPQEVVMARVVEKFHAKLTEISSGWRGGESVHSVLVSGVGGS